MVYNNYYINTIQLIIIHTTGSRIRYNVGLHMVLSHPKTKQVNFLDDENNYAHPK